MRVLFTPNQFGKKLLVHIVPAVYRFYSSAVDAPELRVAVALPGGKKLPGGYIIALLPAKRAKIPYRFIAASGFDKLVL